MGQNPPRELKAARSPRRELVPAALVIIVITAIAYLPAFRAGWIWDDPQYILNNHMLRDLPGLFDIWFHPTSIPQWYPLVHTSFWIEYQWFGPNPTVFHTTNIVLHTISALLLWRLLARLNVAGAWLCAAIFAVHPVHVESVAWVTERKNVLSLLFYLCAMRVYLLHAIDIESPVAVRRHLRKRYAIALLLFICALASKTVTSTLPAAILVIIWWKRGRITRRDVLPLIPFFLIGLTMSAVTGYLEHTHVGADGTRIVELNLNPIQRIFIASRAIWFYAAKLLLPINLAFIYPRWDSIDRAAPWLWTFTIALVAILITLIRLRHRTGRGTISAVLLFCGTLVPALGFVNVYPMRFSFVADHFQYHASIYLIALCAAIIWRFIGRVQPYVVSAALIIPLMISTYMQSQIYFNAETLWRDTLGKNDRSWMVYTNLANALRDTNRMDEADPMYLKALELDPKIHDTHANAGNVYGRHGQYDRAIAEFAEALRINPDFAPAYFGWGVVLEEQKKPDEAIEKFRQAIAKSPHYWGANFRLGQLLEQRGERVEAIERYRQALAANPEFAPARFRLGALLSELGQYDEALGNLFAAVQLDPMNHEAWTAFGNAQLATGHTADAQQSFAQALTIRPGFAPAVDGVQRARAASGR